MIVSITGGTGFIGRRLAQRHANQGDCVRVLSRKPGKDVDLPDAIEWHQGDLSLRSDLVPFVDGADVLYHCAGQISVQERMHEVHVDGTRRLIQAASRRIGRWVQLSSVGVYGRKREGVVTEQAAINPIGIYEQTKAEADHLVQDAATRGAFDMTILRPSNVYGSDMKNQSLFGLISMIKKKLFFYIGQPGSSANYIHVDNVVSALMLCAMHDCAKNNVYNLSDYRTFEDFVSTISSLLHISSPIIRLPYFPIRILSKMFSIYPMFPLTESRIDALTVRSTYSIKKIENELGYFHCVSMEDGLQEMVKSLSKVVQR